MARWLTLAFLVWAGPGCAHLKGPVGLGEILDFELEDTLGDQVRLRDQRGRVVLVAFWGPECRSCGEQLPRLSDLYTRLEAEGLEILAVASRGTPEEVDAFLEIQALPFPTLLDPEARLMRRLGLVEIPAWILVDAYGRVVHVHTPAPDDAFWKLEWVVRRGLQKSAGASANVRPVRSAKSGVASRSPSL